MNLNSINNLVVIINFGSLLLLSFVCFLNPLKVNRKGNKWFAVFLFFYASFWMEEVAMYSGIGEVNKILGTVVHITQVFIPMLFLLCVMFYSQPNFKIKTKYWPHLIFPIIFGFLQIKTLSDSSPWVRNLSIAIILSQSLFYSGLSYIKIKQHKKHILLFFSNTEGISLKWLEYIIIQIIIICLIFLFHTIFISSTNLGLYINLIQLITVFIIAYFTIGQKEIFPATIQQKTDVKSLSFNEEDSNEKKKVLPDEELAKLKNRLLRLMDDNKPFLDPELNLVKLAEQLEITPHQLSYLINTGFNENFYHFVNRYRVEKAKEILRNDNGQITMLAVAFDAGFNSKTSFNTAFKRITKETPSEFKNQCADS